MNSQRLQGYTCIHQETFSRSTHEGDVNYDWRPELESCSEEHLMNAELNSKHKKSHYPFANNLKVSE